MTSPYIRLELAEYGTTNVPVDAPVDVPVNPVEDWDCQIILEEYMVSEKDRLVNKSIEAFILNLIIDFYDVKREQRFAYKHTIGKQEQFTYSQQFIEFILGEMKKNPNTFVESLRKSKR